MKFPDDIDDSIASEEELAAYRENMAKHKAIVQSMIGRRIETAVMVENRSLMMSSRGVVSDERMTETHWDVMPDDPSYEETCKFFGVEKPGDIRSKEYRWINDEWVLAD